MYRFLCSLALPGRPVWHTVFTGNPQNIPKVPKMGGPPFLGTFSGTCHGYGPPCRRFSPKSAEIPLLGWSAGGGSALFGLNRRQGVLDCRQLPEKVVKKGCTPILGTFWRFWGFPVKTVCQTGLPEDASQLRKRYTTLGGSFQRCSRGCISHSLRVWSPNTPSGGPLR